jgi:pyridoxal phosphate phosphatase PHOSPHO2
MIHPCPGEELTNFLTRHPDFDRIIYVGDGSNDFCPVLRLRRFVPLASKLHLSAHLSSHSQDICLCRKYRGLEKRIEREGETQDLRCQVEYWTGAWEAEEIFASLP